jgi:hypothetical protein
VLHKVNLAAWILWEYCQNLRPLPLISGNQGISHFDDERRTPATLNERFVMRVRVRLVVLNNALRVRKAKAVD